MGWEKRKKERQKNGSFRDVALMVGLKDFSSNLYGLLISSTDYTSYLKVMQRDGGDWLAMAGCWTNEGLPKVCFGNGATFLEAMRSLSASMAANKWRDDPYGKPAIFV